MAKSLLAVLARAQLQVQRLQRFKDDWAPSEEERAAMAEGTLIVIPIVRGPRIVIDLRDEPPRPAL
jgi:hypothetical protein